MTRFVLRTDPQERADRDPDSVLLDWFDQAAQSTVRFWASIALNTTASVGASALMRFATAVSVVDRLEPRHRAIDGWTRDIVLSLPARGAELLADPVTGATLSFLSGDRWKLEARDEPLALMAAPQSAADVVCLLSGGLDSLIGAINLLADDDQRQVLLVGVRDQPASIGLQTKIAAELLARYPGRVRHVWGAVDLLPAQAAQLRALPTSREDSTRSRSLLFMAFGLLCASAAGPNVALHVPENGMIGLNVPLIGSRSGSASTRTTHPHFMADLAALTVGLGITNPVLNPLRLMTKGEALAACPDQAAIRALAPISVSCAHPTASRWLGRPGPCGYCYPCLIRRASMHTVGLDDGTNYVFDVLTQAGFLASMTSSRPASLRAVLTAVRRGVKSTDVLANGPVPSADTAGFAAVHARGTAELETWLRTATAPEIAAWLA